MSGQARIQLNVFDGTRQLINSSLRLLVTLRDGNLHEAHKGDHFGPTINFDVDFFNNLGDNYSVIVSAKKHLQAGFHPVKVTPALPRTVDLMLLPKKNRFDFSEASFAKLKKNQPKLVEILARAFSSEAEAKAHYEEFMDKSPGSLAAFLNITTAMRDINLPIGKALDYFKKVIWDELSVGPV